MTVWFSGPGLSIHVCVWCCVYRLFLTWVLFCYTDTKGNDNIFGGAAAPAEEEKEKHVEKR